MFVVGEDLSLAKENERYGIPICTYEDNKIPLRKENSQEDSKKASRVSIDPDLPVFGKQS